MEVQTKGWKMYYDECGMRDCEVWGTNGEIQGTPISTLMKYAKYKRG
jgi:hypothetical protein